MIFWNTNITFQELTYGSQNAYQYLNVFLPYSKLDICGCWRYLFSQIGVKYAQLHWDGISLETFVGSYLWMSYAFSRSLLKWSARLMVPTILSAILVRLSTSSASTTTPLGSHSQIGSSQHWCSQILHQHQHVMVWKNWHFREKMEMPFLWDFFHFRTNGSTCQGYQICHLGFFFHSN